MAWFADHADLREPLCHAETLFLHAGRGRQFALSEDALQEFLALLIATFGFCYEWPAGSDDFPSPPPHLPPGLSLRHIPSLGPSRLTYSASSRAREPAPPPLLLHLLQLLAFFVFPAWASLTAPSAAVVVQVIGKWRRQLTVFPVLRHP